MKEDKSTLAQIRARFDADVERFSDLSRGHQAAPDSPQCMQWAADAARAIGPEPVHVLDLGCGAGNYSLHLLKQVPDPSAVSVTLVDLSAPMLDRAESRLREAGVRQVEAMQCDLLTLARERHLPTDRFDVVMAAAVLHHLRGAEEWRAVFQAVFAAVAPGGSWWIVDLILQADPRVNRCMWERYDAYLVNLQDAAYRDAVFAYIAQEDTPRPLVWQLRLLEEVGFTAVDVLHKNVCMAAFGGVKPPVAG